MSNFLNALSVIVVGLVGGIAVGLQGPMAGFMGQRIGPIGSSFILHFGGAVISAILILFGIGADFKNIRELPLPYFIAGGFGVILYLSFAYTLPRVGVVTTTVLLLLAQMIIGLVLDHYGWMGVAQHPVSFSRILGIGVILVGAFLASR
jgi:bacterial/archaeal transporter family-2 protein